MIDGAYAARFIVLLVKVVAVECMQRLALVATPLVHRFCACMLSLSTVPRIKALLQYTPIRRN